MSGPSSARLEHSERTALFDEDGVPVSANRHANPDGSLGGWVAIDAVVPSDCWLHRDAIVLSGARLAPGSRILHALVIGPEEVAA